MARPAPALRRLARGALRSSVSVAALLCVVGCRLGHDSDAWHGVDTEIVCLDEGCDSRAGHTALVSAECRAEGLLAVRPADESTVPPEVPVEIQLDWSCPAERFALVDATGSPVRVDESLAIRTVRLVPTSALTPGAYTLRWGAKPISGFQVAEEAIVDSAGAPAVIALHSERVCGEEALSSAIVDVSLEPDLEGWGTLGMELSTENGEQARVEVFWYGQPSMGFRAYVFGRRKVCASASMRSPTGEERWVTTPVCVVPISDCPTATDGGGGCSSAPARASWGLALVTWWRTRVAIRAGRRRRGKT